MLALFSLFRVSNRLGQKCGGSLTHSLTRAPAGLKDNDPRAPITHHGSFPSLSLCLHYRFLRRPSLKEAIMRTDYPHPHGRPQGQKWQGDFCPCLPQSPPAVHIFKVILYSLTLIPVKFQTFSHVTHAPIPCWPSSHSTTLWNSESATSNFPIFISSVNISFTFWL